MRPFSGTCSFLTLDLSHLTFSAYSLHLSSHLLSSPPTFSFPIIHLKLIGGHELQDIMCYPNSSLLIPYKKLYIQTSKLDMQRQTSDLDFRTFFTLSTKPDFPEYSLAVDSKIEASSFKEKQWPLCSRLLQISFSRTLNSMP